MKRLISVMMWAAVLGGGCTGDAATNEEAHELVGPSHACDTPQIFGTPAGTGPLACSPIDKLRVQAVLVSDPNAAAENADRGFLSYHPTSPLSRGNMFFVETKNGFTNDFDRGAQTWGVDAYSWVGATPVKTWHIDSKWKPFDAINPAGITNNYEQLFQPALVNTGAFAGLLVPTESGALLRVDPATGKQLALVNPLAGTAFDGDPLTLVNNAIGVGPDGTAAYTVVAWAPNAPFRAPVRGAWLVVLHPDGTTSVKPWAQVVATAAAIPAESGPTGQCSDFFFLYPGHDAPWPSPDANSPPVLIDCGQQVPSINARITFFPGGDMLVMSTAVVATEHSFLARVPTSTLSATWSTEVKEIAHDGCGILIAQNDATNSDFNACRFGARLGVDPFFNEFPHAEEGNIMESAPIIAPDGKIFLGTYTGPYDNNDGHLVVIDGVTGAVINNNPFGFEITPAIYVTGRGPSDYQVVAADNRYDPQLGGEGIAGKFSVSRFTPTLHLIASHTEVNDAAKIAHDYVDGQPAVATDGSSYHLSAEGRVDRVSPTGQLLDSVDLGISLEPLAAELSTGTDGLGHPVVFVTFAGNVYVIGSSAMSGVITHAAIGHQRGRALDASRH